MPNNQREDFVSPHMHSPDDVQGLAILTPPPVAAEGTTADPTTMDALFTGIPEMTIPVTPPDTFPLWEVTVYFNGQFSSNAAPGSIIVKLQQDGADIGTPRGGTSISSPEIISLQQTVQVAGGTTVSFTALWSNPTLASTATADGTRRRISASMRPVSG